jgi:hypothetical protein
MGSLRTSRRARVLSDRNEKLSRGTWTVQKSPLSWMPPL